MTQPGIESRSPGLLAHILPIRPMGQSVQCSLNRVIPKTQKMVLDAALPSTQHYKVRIKGKWNKPANGVVPSPTPWCCSY